MLIAVAIGSAVITACGVLLETGLSSGAPAERYHRAAVVVGGNQAVPVEGDTDPRLSERVSLPAATVAKVAAVQGVESAVGDISVRTVVLRKGSVLDGPPVYGHGWSAAAPAPFTLRSGTRPQAADDVVLDSDLAQRAGLARGDTVTLVTGSKPTSYRVSGVAEPESSLDRQSAVFFTDDQAARLYGTSGKIDAVGVLASKGTGADDLADRIKKAVPGVVTYTGDDRSDVETLDAGQMRAFVVEVASAFGATMILLVIIVVSGTPAPSVQQRRRELALLRAVGATPRQVLRMIGGEAVIVGGIGAVLGAVPRRPARHAGAHRVHGRGRAAVRLLAGDHAAARAGRPADLRPRGPDRQLARGPARCEGQCRRGARRRGGGAQEARLGSALARCAARARRPGRRDRAADRAAR